MQRLKIGLLLWVSLIIIAWGKNDGFSQVCVTVPDMKVGQDSIILVPVLVSDLSDYNIIAYQFKVFFDSLVIKAKGVSAANTLTEPWGNAVANTDSAGKMMVGAFGINALTAGDTLLKLIFKIIAKPGDSTSIIIKDFRFNNGNPAAIVDNGSVQIMLQSGIKNRPPAAIPQTMQLLSNYPEPFQDRTSILLQLDQPGQIGIEIYNLLGRRIKQYETIKLNAGSFVVEWSATDDAGNRVHPGVYFCAVRQDNSILAVKKMILVR